MRALPGLLLPAGAARALPLVDRITRAQARQPLVQVAVGNTMFCYPDDIINDTTSNSLNSRKLCYAPTGSDMTDIQLAFPGFGNQEPEADFPVTYTVTAASIEYPLGTTPQQVFFPGGSGSLTVSPGRNLPKSLPWVGTVPAGAQFAVKCDVTWTAGNFWLITQTAASMIGEWTIRGTGLASHALDKTTFSTTSNAGGFCPAIYATLLNPLAVLGMIGDSAGSLTSDQIDLATGHLAWGRAMRNAIPFINLSKGGDSFAAYSTRPDGRNLLLRNAITHLIWEIIGNDLFGGDSLATLQGNLQSGIGPFLDRGVKCYAITATPRTTSTDGWITAANQTVSNPTVEAVRVAYNAWLRANWQSVGLSGIFDLAHALDPGDTGKWGCDVGGSYPAVSFAARGFATLSGGAISSVAVAAYNAAGSNGNGYPEGETIPCNVYAYPNMGGSGGAVNAITASNNPWVNTFSVVSPGAGYTYPPMIAPKGPWTYDGVHPDTRGIDEFIYQSGQLPASAVIAPETFVL